MKNRQSASQSPSNGLEKPATNVGDKSSRIGSSSIGPRRFFPSKPKPAVICVLLFVLVVCAFLPCLRNEFVTFDDGLYITGNRHVQSGFTWSSVVWAFSSLEGGIWHPLTWFSIILDWQLFGLHPAGHHFTNVLLHAANTVLLFVLFRRMTNATWRSALVAALFALHPLHVESVAWASERKDVLSTFFALLSLCAYVRYVEARKSAADGPGSSFLAAFNKRREFWYGLAWIFFACGLMSKSMVVTLPVILLLLDFWPLQRVQNPLRISGLKNVLPLVWEKLPFFAAAFASSLVTMHSQKVLGALVTSNELPIANRIANGILSYGFYLRKMLWPENLSVFYPYPKTFFVWSVAGVAVLLVSISFFSLWSSHKRPYLAVGWLWYVLTLLPVIGFIQVGSQSQADRYTYVPLIGVFLALVWGAYDFTIGWQYRRIILSTTAATAILVCFTLTYRQIGFWKESETLFRHALAVTKDNRTAHDNLGTALLRKGQVDEAIGHFREALRLKPGDPEELNNLGLVLLRSGHIDEALTNLQRAALLQPDNAATHYSLGLAYGQQRRFPEAISEFEQTLKLSPDDTDALCGLGISLIREGRPDEAITPLQRALSLNPALAEAHCNLGAVLASKGRLEESISQLQQAISLKPGYAEAHHSLGIMLGMSGRLNEAVAQFEEAVKLSPENAENHCSLGIGFARQNRFDEAIKEFGEALRFSPNYPEAHCNLGAALARQGRLDEAISHLRTAIALKPGYSAAESDLRGALAAKDAQAHSSDSTSKP